MSGMPQSPSNDFVLVSIEIITFIDNGMSSLTYAKSNAKSHCEAKFLKLGQLRHPYSYYYILSSITDND